MTDAAHMTRDQLESGLDAIRAAPADTGVVRMIVRRPTTNGRQTTDVAELSAEDGLVGDNWRTREPSPDPDRQLTIMSARAAQLIAQDESRWALAGDQFYIDMDVSIANLPAGARLTMGDAVIQVTEPPHLGCRKFKSRFGADALAFVNSDVGKELRLRGLNARVVRAGRVRVGDGVTRLVATTGD